MGVSTIVGGSDVSFWRRDKKILLVVGLHMFLLHCVLRFIEVVHTGVCVVVVEHG